MKIVRSNGKPLLSDKSLMKHPSTRLRFSIFVIIANFALGIVGMVLGSDLTALGVFLAMANVPLYTYVLGDSFRPNKIPDSYFEQAHSGSGGLGTILHVDTENKNINSTNNSTETDNKNINVTMTQIPDEFNNQNAPQTGNVSILKKKPTNEIG